MTPLYEKKLAFNTHTCRATRSRLHGLGQPQTKRKETWQLRWNPFNQKFGYADS